MREINLGGFFMEKERLDFDKMVEGYRTYVKRRGFRCFREKDKKGKWIHIKETALVYSFETFVQTLLLNVFTWFLFPAEKILYISRSKRIVNTMPIVDFRL
jgi:hypothetical protein